MLYTKAHSGDWCDVLRWSQRLIDMADGDPSKGNFMVGCPLALAVAARAAARYCLGRPGWRDDLRHGLAMSRSTDAMSYATVVAWVYGAGISLGVLAADDRALCEIEDALQVAERSGDDVALSNARMTLGVALAHRQETADRDRGQQVLAKVSQVLRRPGYNLCDLPIVEVYLARESARRGESDVAIPLMRAAVDQMVREGQLLGWGPPATGVLVETLLERGTENDRAEAEAAIERLAAAPADDGGDTRHLAAAAARPAGPGPRRRRCLPRLSRSLSRDGGIAWLRRTHRDGRGADRRWGIVGNLTIPRSCIELPSTLATAGVCSGDASGVLAGKRLSLSDAVRDHKARNGAGAHQFALPSSLIAAGKSTARIRVASIRIASVIPTPDAFTNDTWDAAIARHTIDMMSAAAVTMGPTRCSPYITAALVSPRTRYSSVIRDSRNTS